MKTIAILQATSKETDSLKGFEEDSQRFIDLLSLSSNEYQFEVFQLQEGEFPTSITSYDGFIITGSSSSVNEKDAWLQKLFKLIQDITTKKVPLFGCCFGHQAIAKAFGGEVAANPFGWSLGTEITEFTRHEFWRPDSIRKLRLFSAHQEQVIRIPPKARIIGTNNRCPIAAMAIGNNVFSTQYHPEITPEFMTAIIKVMEQELGNKIEDSLNQMKLGSEMKPFAQCLANFFNQPIPDKTSVESDQIGLRCLFAERLSYKAGKMAMQYFRDFSSLIIEDKGVHNPVSNADRSVEQMIRDEISKSFPDDGVIGEEFPIKYGVSEFNWVIDPIDGTSNFIREIPSWVVSIACIQNSLPIIGSLYAPVYDELYFSRRNCGAHLNHNPIIVANAEKLSDGLTGIGISSQSEVNPAPLLTETLLKQDGMFVRSGSGALDLAYVASGRYIAFMENYMKSWDCLAGILIAEEAGAIIHAMDYDKMLDQGGTVVASAPGVHHKVKSISKTVFGV